MRWDDFRTVAIQVRTICVKLNIMDNTWEARQSCCVDISFSHIPIGEIERLGFCTCQSPALGPTQYHGDLMHRTCNWPRLAISP